MKGVAGVCGPKFSFLDYKLFLKESQLSSRKLCFKTCKQKCLKLETGGAL